MRTLTDNISRSLTGQSRSELKSWESLINARLSCLVVDVAVAIETWETGSALKVIVTENKASSPLGFIKSLFTSQNRGFVLNILVQDPNLPTEKFFDRIHTCNSFHLRQANWPDAKQESCNVVTVTGPVEEGERLVAILLHSHGISRKRARYRRRKLSKLWPDVRVGTISHDT